MLCSVEYFLKPAMLGQSRDTSRRSFDSTAVIVCVSVGDSMKVAAGVAATALPKLTHNTVVKNINFWIQ